MNAKRWILQQVNPVQTVWSTNYNTDSTLG